MCIWLAEIPTLPQCQHLDKQFPSTGGARRDVASNEEGQMNPDPPYNFEPDILAKPLPADWIRFKVGELIGLKGYIFRIDAILPNGIVLKPVQKAQEANLI